MSLNKEDLIKDAYYNKRISASALYKYLNGAVTHNDIKNFLSKQTVAQQHKKTKILYHSTVGTDDSYQIDLMFYGKYARQNHGFNGALLCINVDTRKAYGYPIKTKSASEIYLRLLQFLSDIKFKIKSVTVDEGNEWLNAVRELFSTHGITIYVSNSTNHGSHAIIDRFTRTIKDKIERYFTETKSVKWVDVFKDLLQGYNESNHKTLGTAPNKVTEEKIQDIRDAARKKGEKAEVKFNNLKIHDTVRVLKNTKTFEKGVVAKWSPQLYTIVTKSGYTFGVVNKENLNDAATYNDTYLHYQLQKVHESSQSSDTTTRDQIDREKKIERRIRKENIEPVDLRLDKQGLSTSHEPRPTRIRNPVNMLVNSRGEAIRY